MKNQAKWKEIEGRICEGTRQSPIKRHATWKEIEGDMREAGPRTHLVAHAASQQRRRILIGARATKPSGSSGTVFVNLALFRLLFFIGRSRKRRRDWFSGSDVLFVQLKPERRLTYYQEVQATRGSMKQLRGLAQEREGSVKHPRGMAREGKVNAVQQQNTLEQNV